MSTNRSHRGEILAQASADDLGATAVEYALLAALITAVIAGIVGTFGIQIRDLFTSLIGAF